MKKEDIEFLRELQHELKTQDHDCQAAPRFWGVLETVKLPTSEDYADGSVIFDTEDMTEYSKDEFIELLNESWNEVEHEDHSKEDLRGMDMESLVDFARDEFGWQWYDVRYYLEKEVVSQQTGCFLTKRVCQRHIELNGYHYNKGHTYAMTAWRNPEFERLLDILTNMNIDDIKEE